MLTETDLLKKRSNNKWGIGNKVLCVQPLDINHAGNSMSDDSFRKTHMSLLKKWRIPQNCYVHLRDIYDDHLYGTLDSGLFFDFSPFSEPRLVLLAQFLPFLLLENLPQRIIRCGALELQGGNSGGSWGEITSQLGIDHSVDHVNHRKNVINSMWKMLELGEAQWRKPPIGIIGGWFGQPCTL